MTAGGKLHRLPQPFFVLATQNPIEQEGTYPLPEAQLDRFMFNINVGYPTEDEEFQIVRLTTPGQDDRSAARAQRRRGDAASGDRAQGAGGRSRDPLRAAVHAPDAQDRSGGVFRISSRTMSAGAPGRGQPVSDSRRQGPGAAQGPLSRQHRRHPAGGAAGAAASHRDQLQRRGRGDQERHDREEADRHIPRQQYDELDKTAAKMLRDQPAA